MRRIRFMRADGIEITTDDRRCLVIKADYLDETVVTNDIVELTEARQFRYASSSPV